MSLSISAEEKNIKMILKTRFLMMRGRELFNNAQSLEVVAEIEKLIKSQQLRRSENSSFYL